MEESVATPDAWTGAPPHPLEDERVVSLRSLNILDTPAEKRFDLVVELVASIFRAPIAFVSLIDADRQWFKSEIGLGREQVPRSDSLCAFALQEDSVLVVPDAKADGRFSHNPLVCGMPGIRFYAGAVIRDGTGLPIGTVAIADLRPRALSRQQRRQLADFARLVRMEIIPESGASDARVRAQVAARIDPLTNAYGLAEFRSQLEAAMRAPGGGVSLVLVKLSSMKAINARFGHEAGDRALLAVSDVFHEVLGPDAVYGRDGSSVFAMLPQPREGIPVSEVARAALPELEAPLARYHTLVKPLLRVAVIDDCREFGSGDEVLFASKSLIAGWQPAASSVLRTAADINSDAFRKQMRARRDLSDRLGTDELELFYQPKVDTRSGEICGFEALLRWYDSELGWIPPNDIVDAAHDTGFGDKLMEWTLRAACREMHRWRGMGLPLKPVSVNVADPQLSSPGFADMVLSILDTYEIPHDMMQLELLESAIVRDEARIIETMEALGRSGVSFALDDFGTGYSALAYIARLPIGALKIDRSLVVQIAENDIAASLVQSVITMARDAGLATIAEGVEDAAQYFMLRAYRCNAIQGYLFSRPQPSTSMTALLSNGARLPLPSIGG